MYNASDNFDDSIAILIRSHANLLLATGFRSVMNKHDANAARTVKMINKYMISNPAERKTAANKFPKIKFN